MIIFQVNISTYSLLRGQLKLWTNYDGKCYPSLFPHNQQHTSNNARLQKLHLWTETDHAPSMPLQRPQQGDCRAQNFLV